MKTLIGLLMLATVASAQVRGNFVAEFRNGSPVLPSLDLKYQDGVIRIQTNGGDSITVPNIKGGWQMLSYAPDTTVVIQILTSPAKMEQLKNNDTLIYIDDPDTSLVSRLKKREELWAQAGGTPKTVILPARAKKPIPPGLEKKIQDKFKAWGRGGLGNEKFPDDSTLVEKILKAHGLDKPRYKAQGLGK